MSWHADDGPPSPCTHPVRSQYEDAHGVRVCGECGARGDDERAIPTTCPNGCGPFDRPRDGWVFCVAGCGYGQPAGDE